MPRKLLLAVVTAVCCLAPAASAAAQEPPTRQVLYQDGPTNRMLLGGTWLFRLDPGNRGLGQGLNRATSTEGWQRVRVPNAWNATDDSPESMKGTIGWYRRDFRLPNRNRRLDWVVRFESVNYRSQVWVNGRRVGSNRGAYLPFEIRIPGRVLRRRGVNRLVVRVENVRKPFDLPPSGFSRTSVPTGGWWNYGGILREVYLKRVDRADFSTVQVLPRLACRTCAARIDFRVTARNFARSGRRLAVTGSFGGQRVTFDSKSVGGRSFATFRSSIRVRRPKLWSPRHPTLYTVKLGLRAGGRQVNRWVLKSGIRSFKVQHGRLTLNGLPVNIRGFGFHEDQPGAGFASDNRFREQLVTDARDAGATMMRAHYPVHPHLYELADRIGMLMWSEIPMYSIKTQYLTSVIVRKAGANELRDNVLANGNHPSVATWSVGNELSSKPGPSQGDYLLRAARQARALDPTRPISYAVAGYPSAGCQSEYAPLSILGVNEYFGWYPGPNGELADRSVMSEYLDQVRRCYPDKAIMVTETGAEANRSGPPEEKGTYEFQKEFANYHFGVYAQKPWLSGAMWWALREFKVRPEWEGGNPRPAPPLHQKGVVAYDGTRKPAYADLQQLFRATDQYPGD